MIFGNILLLDYILCTILRSRNRRRFRRNSLVRRSSSRRRQGSLTLCSKFIRTIQHRSWVADMLWRFGDELLVQSDKTGIGLMMVSYVKYIVIQRSTLWYPGTVQLGFRGFIFTVKQRTSLIIFVLVVSHRVTILALWLVPTFSRLETSKSCGMTTKRSCRDCNNTAYGAVAAGAAATCRPVLIASHVAPFTVQPHKIDIQL